MSEDEPNRYEEKQEARRERLLARADKQQAESSSRYAAARRTLDVIPMGQPVLVGHHSEKRHRRDLERVDNNLRKSFEASDNAAELRRRAEAVGTAGISSDDPDAIEKLEGELADARAWGAIVKLWNKRIRDAAKAESKKLGRELTHGEHKDLVTKLPEDCPDVVRKGLARSAFAFPWLPQLGTDAPNARRIEKRIEELKKRDADPERETIEGAIDGLSFKIEDNKHANRVQIWFSDKPSDELRSKLRRAAFKWSHTGGVWQRMRSNGAWYSAKQVLGVP